MTPPRAARWLLVLPLLTACGDKGGDDTAAATEAVDEAAWEDETLYGYANLDDDDEDGRSDWNSDADEEDDHFDLVLPASLADGAPEGARLHLRLGGKTAKVAVWQDGAILLSDDAKEVDVDLPGDDLTLEVEFKQFRRDGRLDVSLVDADGAEVRKKRIELVSAPLILNHHLQPAEKAYAMRAGGAQGNGPFTDGLAAGLGDRLETFSLSSYGWDVWIEDEIELATLTAPGGRRMDVVIDSIRSPEGQYLGALPADELERPGVAVRTWGEGWASSQDSFGNMEVSPPVTVDGVNYPFGRIYYGKWYGDGPVGELTDMLADQKVQAPFTQDVSFLCVGHVDEFTTFLPDPTAPKGWRLYVADIPLAYAFLEAQDQGTSLPRYAADHGYATIGEIVEDDELRALNEDIQVDYIDPAIEVFKAELGLTEDDIVRIPGMFEVVRGCGGTTVGLIPGTANMLVTPQADGPLQLYMPDPFLRTDDEARDADPFIAEIEAALPEAEYHWIDDWDWYHIMLGEVHCGTNAVRTPIENWWEAATHLLADEEG